MPIVDLTGVDENASQGGVEFEKKTPVIMEPNKYPVKCVDSYEKYSSRGTLFFQITFVVENGKYKGNVLWDRLYFTDKTKPHVKHVLKHMGFNVDGQISVNAEDLIGRMCIVQSAPKDLKDEEGHPILDEKTGEQKKTNQIDFHGYSDYNASDYPEEGTVVPF